MAVNVQWEAIPKDAHVHVHFKVVDSADDRICYRRDTIRYAPSEWVRITQAEFVATVRERFDPAAAVSDSALEAQGETQLLDALPKGVEPLPDELDELGMLTKRVSTLETDVETLKSAEITAK